MTTDRDIENKMLIDGYWLDDDDDIDPGEYDWPDDEDNESEWEMLCRKADEEYDYDDGAVGWFDGGGVRSYRV